MIKKLFSLFEKEPVTIPPPKKQPTPSNPYRAVAVVPGLACCEAAKAKRHIRMLMRSAPTLPLANCSLPQRCACHFARFEDRRASQRRSFLPNDTQRVWYSGAERRVKRGRRKDDI